ncbi:hypothetical protein WG66_011889, partial [Moniliophthora roreri]
MGWSVELRPKEPSTAITYTQKMKGGFRRCFEDRTELRFLNDEFIIRSGSDLYKDRHPRICKKVGIAFIQIGDDEGAVRPFYMNDLKKVLEARQQQFENESECLRIHFAFYLVTLKLFMSCAKTQESDFQRSRNGTLYKRLMLTVFLQSSSSPGLDHTRTLANGGKK